jgi:hypothetical protein
LHRKLVKPLEGDFTHRSGFLGLGRYRVGLGIHARQADQFAGQVEARDLLFAAVAEAEGFQGPGTYCVDRAKTVTLAEQKLAFLERSPAFDDFIQCVHVFQVQRKRQAQGGQAAILAMGLVVWAQFDWLGHLNRSLWESTHKS